MGSVPLLYPPNFTGEIIDRTGSDGSVSTLTDASGPVSISTFGFLGSARDDSSIALPRGRWTCVEVLIDYDAPSRASLFIDGASAASFDFDFPSVLLRSQFGITYRDPDAPADYFLYIDDVAIGTERIGCDE